jgi:hypothetical protein
MNIFNLTRLFNLVSILCMSLFGLLYHSFAQTYQPTNYNEEYKRRVREIRDSTAKYCAMIKVVTSDSLPQGKLYNRKYISQAVTDKHTLIISGVSTLLYPIVYKGNIYGVARNQNTRYYSVLKLDTLGNTLNIFGNFSIIKTFSIQNDTICIVDSDNLAISEWTLQGKEIRSFDFGSQGYITRGIKISTDKYLVKYYKSELHGNKQEEFFYLTDFVSQTRQKTVVPQLDAQLDDQIAGPQLDGNFISNGNGFFFRYVHCAGQFTCFDSNGKYLYNCRTIDSSGLPDVIKSGKMLKSIGRLVNLSAAADGRYLYILSNALMQQDDPRQELSREQVIDVYSIYDGGYMYSFKLPDSEGKSNIITSSSKGLYVIYSNKLVHYTLTIP